MLLRKLFARPAPLPRLLPEGERVYAVGDIHGRSDCLDTLMARVVADDKARPPVRTTLVFLGDLTDRGPDSRGVVERLMAIDEVATCVFLMGNHEEMLIDAWDGDISATRLFHRVGGRETMLSYGMDAGFYDEADSETLATLIGQTIPVSHVDFLRTFRNVYTLGDYIFVHAGIRPGVPIDEQDPADLRWIRRAFLEDTREHGGLVIHGHSITESVDEHPNRIGIDTGAYASGRLTAVGIEGSDRWYLSSKD